MRTPKIETDYFGKICLRIFPYTKNEKPTVIGYFYGSITVVRPVMVVNSKGKLDEKYELANMSVNKDGEFEKLITEVDDNLIEPFLNYFVTDAEFEKLDRTIVSHF